VAEGVRDPEQLELLVAAPTVSGNGPKAPPACREGRDGAGQGGGEPAARAARSGAVRPRGVLQPQGIALPHSEETERAVLGAILLRPEDLETAARTLRPDDFYSERHQLLYQAFLDLSSDETAIDERTTQAILEQRGQLELVGGLAYLTGLDLDLPDIGRLETYAAIVKERSIRRRLIQTAGDVIRDSLDGGRTAPEVLETFQRQLGVLAQAAGHGPAGSEDVPDIITLGELARKIIPVREDVLAGVLKVGDASCICGQPGRGKSLVAVAAAIAIASGRSFTGLAVPRARPVLYVDGELLESEVKERSTKLAAGLGITQGDIGGLPLQFIIELAQAEDPPKLTTKEGRARFERYLDRHPETEVIFLDSLRTLFGLGDENKSESWSPVNDFHLALKRRGLSVVSIHHNSRQDTFNGHLSGATAFSQIVNLTARAEGEDNAEVTALDWSYSKARSLIGAEKVPFGLKLESEPDGRLYWARCDASSRKKKPNRERPPHPRRREALELRAQGVPVRRVAEKLGVSPSSVQAWADEGRDRHST
jgi:hypothetical protein